MHQLNKFVPKGINCDFVGEAQTDKEAISNVVAGKIQLVFISPEFIICYTLYWTMMVLLMITMQHSITAFFSISALLGAVVILQHTAYTYDKCNC